MARIAKNSLTITPLSDGRFYLSGSCSAKSVRLKFTDLHEAETKKAELENDATRLEILAATRPEPRYTWLDDDQIKKAQALFTEFARLPLPLGDYIRAGMATLGDGKLTLIEDAKTAWKTDMETEQKLKAGSVSRNIQYLTLYIREHKPTYVSDITTKSAGEFSSVAKIEALDAERGASIYSRLTRFAVLRAFLSFCVKKEMIVENVLANVETKDDVKLAKKRTKEAAVFTAAQCQALLDAAIETDPRYIPFVLLTTWLFARQEEVWETTPKDVRFDVKTPYVQFGSNKLGTPNHRKTLIPDNILPLLKECIDTGLWAKDTTPFWSRNSWFNLREKAGLIKLAEPTSKGGRAVLSSDWEKNALRHTGISMLYKKYSDMAEGGIFKEATSISAAVTRQAGNSKDVMFAHYLKDVSTEEMQAFYKITGRLKKVIAQREEQAVA